MRDTWLLILLFVFNGSINAQTGNPNPNPSLTNVVPPSPGAASLGKFGDIPVGYATGIPQINVPIFAYSNADKSLGMSISLDYHAGGIKVDELASNTGIGWALNAGGVITRTKRGTPDEYNYGFMTTPTYPNENEGNRYAVSRYMEIASNTYDSQTDIFNFNVGGKSGKFMFGKNNDFLMLTPNKIKVEYEITSGRFQRFKITDETGTKYIFDAQEVTNSGLTGWDVYASSWYLTKIIAPFATDSILLEYDTEIFGYGTGRYGTQTITFDPGLAAPPNSGGISGSVIHGKRIKKISFPDGTNANFVYDNIARTDIGTYNYAGDLYRLKQVSITNGANQRGYNLYHDYSTNRLTLKSVLPYNAAGEDKGYSFAYYASLPDRLETSQDHWGFYNGNTTQSLFPQESYHVNGTNYPLNGANRETDIALVKNGSLTRMTYPTGGYTDFEMEAHKVYDPRLTYNYITNIKTQFETGLSGLYCSNTTSGWQPFEFGADPNVNTSFTVKFPTGGISSNNIILELKNSANQVVNTQTIPFAVDYTMEYNFSIYNLAAGNYTFHASLQGSDYFDNYLLIEWTETRLNNPDTIYAYVDKPYVGGLRVKSIKAYDGINSMPASTREYEYLKEDGLTSSGALGTYPVYSYGVYYDNIPRTAPSTGPNDYRSYYNNGGSPNSIVRATSPVQALALTNGSPANYSRVVEKFSNNGQSNGKIVRYFESYSATGAPLQHNYPYAPPDYGDHNYGQLVKELVYDKNNTLLKKTENEYTVTTDPYYNTPGRVANFTSLSIAPVKYEFNDDNSLIFKWDLVTRPVYFIGTTYTPATGRKDLVKTTTTEYNGASNLVNEITYTYDAAFNINKTLTKNSRNEQIEEIVHYPYEYTTNAVASAMITQNMYAPSIAIEKWKTIGSNRYLTGGIVNQYQQLASGIRLSSIESFESPAPVITGSVPALNPASFNRAPTLFKEAITFNQYSNKGFVIQQAKSNDVQQSIIWDHNQQMPTAQVIGSSIDKTAYTSFEADGLGGWTMNSGVVFVPDGITGTKSISGGVNKTVPAGNYVVGVWSKSNTWINGQLQTQTPLKVLGTWRYFELLLTNVTSINISGDNIDEVRLYPQGAQMTTYTYDPLIGLTSQCDANNLITYYEYDGFGRLKTVRDENKNIIKTLDYQYQKSYNQ